MGGDSQTQVDMTMEAKEEGLEMADIRVAKKWAGTEADRHDMTVMGRAQELRRNFQFISVMGFGCTLLCTWEVLLTTVQIGLANGGTAGLIWGNIIVVTGMFFVYASIAEMASMAPTSAGQYHWVSEFSPRFCQKYLSYITGWLCFLGWQAGTVVVAFIAGTVIQGLIVLNHPDTYVYEQWHGTLLIIAVTAFSIFFNTCLAKKLPIVEGLILMLHVIGLFVIIIPLWILSPRDNAERVFTNFTNDGGWPTTGLATMIGLTTSLLSILGFDCSVHMSEEIKDAGRTLPRAIMGAVALNSLLGFLMVVTVCFCLGDLTSVLETPTGYPFIQIFYNSTRSLGGTNVLVAIVILALVGGTIAAVATSSRQLWAFARDNGIPGSKFIAQVTPVWSIPLNAVMFSLVTTTLLALINIGSTVALNAVLSLFAGSTLSSYMLCIGCVLLKRIRGETLPARRWSLGRWGMAINIVSMLFLFPLYIFTFFPPATPVVPETMNWACLIYGSIIIGSTLYYLLYGRKVYIPPVSLVKRDI